MRSSVLHLAALLASSSLVAAQTWTACNPLEKTCPDDPALAGTYDHTFGGAPPDFTVTAGDDVIKYGGPDGAIFRVEKKLDAPTIVSDFYIMWGYAEVVMKAAPGGGVVSSAVLQSDDLDEIDWEWVGSKMGEAQSNYFGKGNTDSYDRGAVHPVDANEFHSYAFDWTAEKTDWIIDGTVVRTLRPSEVKGDFYPQTPMQFRLGSWAAGDPGNEEGTVEWSGGPINYKEGPFDMVVKEIKIIDYSTGTAYRYTDKTGSWQSIEAVNGKVGAGPQKGKGNAGNLATSAAGAQSTSRPGGNSKTGVLIPTTSGSPTAKGELATKSALNKAADSAESTSSPSSPSGSVPSGSNGFVTQTTGVSNETVAPTGVPILEVANFGFKNSASGLLVCVAGLVMGWIL